MLPSRGLPHDSNGRANRQGRGTEVLREKELRIALVCFGGISLAVYMHGISKEILKLVRASSALHAIADRSRRAKASFFDGVDRNDPEYDTEGTYFELLREIGRTIEMRVVVDIIAGASAGGINGTMLARALSHDLPMGALRNLWVENADVAVLLAPDARARAWSKWFLKPLLWAMVRTASFRAITDMEVRQKLSLFVRSRWFKPPLDGRVMAGLMYDAVMSMGAPKSARASLLPSGQSLDLFVTLTDYYGYQQLVQIHDPPPFTSAITTTFCTLPIGGIRTARSRATSTSTTRRVSPSPRAPRPRSRARSRRRGSWK